MRKKIMTIVIGGITALSINVVQADTPYERALGVGVNQNYQGGSRSGTEVYPGVWSQGRENRETKREEVYPGVWSESEINTRGRSNVSNNESGYSIVNRSTSKDNGGNGFREREQENPEERIERVEGESRETYRQNSRPTSSNSSSGLNFSGRSSSNTQTETIPEITVRDREHTNVSVDSLINPDFD